MNNQKYSFDDPHNTACIACTHVIKEGAPVLFVSHDDDDGMWQFLCGAMEHSEDEGQIVSLGMIAILDPGLNDIADMPLGVCGERNTEDDEWIFYRM